MATFNRNHPENQIQRVRLNLIRITERIDLAVEVQKGVKDGSYRRFVTGSALAGFQFAVPFLLVRSRCQHGGIDL